MSDKEQNLDPDYIWICDCKYCGDEFDSEDPGSRWCGECRPSNLDYNKKNIEMPLATRSECPRCGEVSFVVTDTIIGQITTTQERTCEICKHIEYLSKANPPSVTASKDDVSAYDNTCTSLDPQERWSASREDLIDYIDSMEIDLDECSRWLEEHQRVTEAAKAYIEELETGFYRRNHKQTCAARRHLWDVVKGFIDWVGDESDNNVSP